MAQRAGERGKGEDTRMDMIPPDRDRMRDAPPEREKGRNGARRGARVSPLYHQVYLLLRDLLLAGELTPDKPLPSEPDLAARFGVSRVTIRKTLEQLEKEGLIRRVRGVGTFANSRPLRSERANISGILENLISIERSTTAINLSWQEVEPEGAVLQAFGYGLALRIVRLRSHSGRPMSLTTLHVPARYKHLVSRESDANEPLVKVLEARGVIAERADQVITAVSADALAAEKLGTSEGAPLICMRRLMLDADRAPVLHQESVYTPDRFEYRMSLTRSSVGPAARWTPIS